MDERLLAILACPVCRAPLRLEGERLVCTATQAAYPIEDGLPILLAERAEPVHPDDRSPAPATPA
jgi:uncharacterized protein YbaR (Trm112 family)